MTTQSEYHYLLRLTLELIVCIISFIDPASYLDFACACKALANCFIDMLRRYREAYSKYSVLSDLNPSIIIDLLLSAYSITDLLIA